MLMPGITNRILGKFVNRIFVTYEQTQTWFPKGKVIISGNPVRAAFVAGRCVEKGKKDFWQLLIFGGSQGAVAINKSYDQYVAAITKNEKQDSRDCIRPDQGNWKR